MAVGSIRKRTGSRGVSWRVRYPVGYDPLTGKREVITGTFRTRREADDFLTRVRHETRQGSYIEPSNEPLASYLIHWLASNRAAPQTKKRYASVIRIHLTPALGHIPLGRLTQRQIQQYYNTLEPTPTARMIHMILKSALSLAVDEDLILKNPCDKVTRPAKSTDRDDPEQRVKAWSLEVLRTFLEATHGHRDWPAWWTQAHTGLRPGELMALRWADLDLEAGTLRVRQGKTAYSRRVIALDPETVAVLRRHRAQQNERRLALGDLWQDHGLVFGGEDGRPVKPNNYSVLFAYHVRKLGLPPLTAHGLRHTHATALLQTRPAHHVSRRLGHANPSITMNIYAHVLPGTDQDDAAAFARAFSEAAETARDPSVTKSGYAPQKH